jgi:hypothetical protein
VIIDLLIVLVVIGAAWVGFQKGLVQPLLAEILALGTLLLILHNRAGFLGLTEALFHANVVLAAVMAIVLAAVMGYVGARLGGAIHKMPVVRGVDGFLGLWLQTLLGIAFCYVVISGIIVMNVAFTPITTPNVNAAQLAALERQLESNPFTSSAVDAHDLRSFNGPATRQGGVLVSDLPGIGPLQGIYRDVLLPQLTGSHLAPFVMSVGRHIPGLGRYGPKDLPRRR